MFKNYFKTAFRSLWKNKAFSALNILGLSVGIAAALLLVNYVRYETSFDQFYKDTDRIYRVFQETKFNGRERTGITGSGLLGVTIEEEFPEVEKMGRSQDVYKGLLKLGATKFYESKLQYADNGLMDILEIKFLEGDKLSALDNPNSIVLTETLAAKLFEDVSEAFGKSFYFKEDLLQVTGVIKDLPKNSHYVATGFISSSSLNTFSWEYNGHRTYLRLHSKNQKENVNSRLPQIVSKYIQPTLPENYEMKMSLFPISNIHLAGDAQQGLGDKKSVLSFSLISLFLIIIASINYMNLATARAGRRAKEIGMRKVIGANKRQLIYQFLSESLTISFISVLLGGFIAELCSNFFQELSGKSIEISFLSSGETLIILILFAILIGLLAGMYPAFYLSSFKPITILKQGIRGSRFNRNMRRSLVSIQFIISIGLIMSTLIVAKQLNFIQNKELGYTTEGMISVRLQAADTAEILKREISQIHGVLAVTATNVLPTSGDSGAPFEIIQENGEILKSTVSFAAIDYDYLPSMQMTLVAGRNFSSDFSNNHNSVIVNETLVKKHGWKNPIGQQLIKGRDDNGNPLNEYTVIGVVKDFNMMSLYRGVKPFALFLKPKFDYGAQYLFVKLENNNVTASLNAIQEAYESFDSETPFTYSFIDDYIARVYLAESQKGKLYLSFSIITIVIACLGLFGLAALILQQRIKEISIRKVLGASVNNIVSLISVEFVSIIIISTVIAAPIAYHLMQNWLATFEYQIEMGWLIFIAAGIFALVLALLTITFQSIRTARSNPVDVLIAE